jgi:signal transduction histidine kinase
MSGSSYNGFNAALPFPGEASWMTLMKLLRCRPFRWNRAGGAGSLSQEEIESIIAILPEPARRWRERLISDIMVHIAGLTPQVEVVYMSTEDRWTRLTAAVQLGVDGEIQHIIGTTQDIHHEHTVNEQQRKMARRMKELVEQLPEAVVVWVDGREVLRNVQADRLLTSAPSAAGVGGLLAQLAKSDRNRVLEHLAAAQRGNTSDAVIARLGELWIELSSCSIQTDEGLAVLTLFRDISARRQLEMHVAAHDRMATVGTLAAGVAHEINNPLCFIQLNLELLREELPQLLELGKVSETERISVTRDLLAKLDDTIVGTGRVQEVVSDLMVFSHTEAQSEEGSADIVEAVQLAMNLGRHRFKHKAQLYLQAPPSIIVSGQIGLLSQVFLNLIVNAIDAIEDSSIADGQIRIRIRRTGSHAEITVEDNGPGIPDNAIARIFDPFFTSKKVGKGSGLGLAISRSIISRCGGTIVAENRRQGGAGFRVRLPISEGDVENEHTEELPLPIPTAHSQILIVDDEEMLLRALARGLSTDFQVTTAQRGERAIELVSEGLDPDIILLDIMLPDRDGSEVYAWMCEHRPHLQERIILMTGGAVTTTTQRFLERTTATVFKKPLKLQLLRNHLRKMLSD